MARGINRVILIGNLGADPESHSTENGKGMATVSIATTESWKNKESNESQERTEWHRVVFFGGLAGISEKYLKKGSKVYVEGKLRTRKWTDKFDRENYTTEVIADELLMLDTKSENNDKEIDF